MEALITDNERLAPGYYRMGLRLRTPMVLPGQFVMLRVSDGLDPLLRRPFGVYDLHGGKRVKGGFTGTGMDLVYKVVGRGTGIMSGKRPGERLDVLGPLGNGFPLPAEPAKAILVAGGMGIVPLHLLAKRLGGARMLFGARGRNEAALTRGFKKGLRIDLATATEDGSVGRKGLVTDLLREEITGESVVYACGPSGMLKAVSKMATAARAKCFVSLERSMACGIGVCLGCAVRNSERALKRGAKPYSMVCSEGPVFDCEDIDWDVF